MWSWIRRMDLIQLLKGVENSILIGMGVKETLSLDSHNQSHEIRKPTKPPPQPRLFHYYIL